MLHNCNKYVINICIGLSTPIVAQYFNVDWQIFSCCSEINSVKSCEVDFNDIYLQTNY